MNPLRLYRKLRSVAVAFMYDGMSAFCAGMRIYTPSAVQTGHGHEETPEALDTADRRADAADLWAEVESEAREEESMLISEFIAKLQQVQAEHGDLPVIATDRYVDDQPPVVEFEDATRSTPKRVIV